MKNSITIIKTTKQYADYIARLFDLLESEPERGSAAFDEMELLALVVAEYEKKLPQVALPTQLEAIKFAMEQRRYTQGDLGNLIGSRSRASEILGGRRKLTITQINLLHQHWHIPLESLMNTGALKVKKLA